MEHFMGVLSTKLKFSYNGREACICTVLRNVIKTRNHLPMKYLIRRLVLLISLASTAGIFPKTVKATHLAGSDITYTCLGGNNYRIDLTFYRDCLGSPAPLGVGIEFRSASCNQYFTDTLLRVTGTGGEITYPCPTVVTSCEDSNSVIPGIQQYSFSGIVTLPMQCSDWVISWTYCCRNCDITTMVQQTPCVTGSNPGMYISATLDNLNVNCDSSPRFTNLPVIFVCVGQNFTYNHGVLDPNGDSLVYSLVNPLKNATDSIPFVTGYSATNPISSSPGLTINPLTGDITMNPTQVEVGVLSVLVQEYRNGVLIGSVIRDMEIYVRPCNNNLPTASGFNGGTNRDTTICPGTNICFDVLSDDIDSGQIVTMSWNSGITGATFTTSGFPHPTGHFCWTAPSSITGTVPFIFTVTVVDDACPNSGYQTYSFTINVNSPIQSLNTTPIACQGDTNGSITVVPSGSGPTYTWSPGGQTTATISNLGPGTYTVTVHDSISGCTATASSVLTDPAALSLSTNVQVQPCAGASGGVAIATASGGTPGYSYSWDTNPVTVNDTATGLSAGVYHITVTDSHGCTILDSVSVTPSANALVVTIDSAVTSLLCYGDTTGQAFASATGGTPGYTYAWYLGTVQVGAGTSISGLGAGIYSIIVTDSIGCTGTDSVTVSSPAALSLLNSSTPATCGMSDGIASVTVSGGSPGYTYLWDTLSATTSSIANVPAGVYQVTVTDTNGCTSTQPIIVNNSTIPPPDAFVSSPISCNGDTDAIAVVLPIGGTPPFTFSWNTVPPQSTDTVFNLAPGIYVAGIVDSNNCMAFDTVVVTEPDPVSVVILSSEPSCNGDSTGIASAQPVTGGTPPYSYSWSPFGGTSQTANNLPAGTYTVTVTDSHNCTGTGSVTIAEPTAMVLTVDALTEPSCYGSADGSIDISVSGGGGSYTYFWNPGGATTQDLQSIDAGIYLVTVTDQHNCSRQFSVNVNQPPPVNVNAGADTALCAGNTIQLNASLQPGESGAWSSSTGIVFGNSSSPNSTATNLSPGFNSLTWTVTDANGCSGSDNLTVFNYSNIVTNAGPDISICGLSQVQLNATSYPGFTGLWNSLNGALFSDPSLNTATVTINNYGTDTLTWAITNGACMTSDALLVNAYENVAADAGPDQTVCANTATLIAQASAPGSGIWTILPPGQGSILSPFSDSTTIRSLTAGNTIIVWTVSNGVCANSDTVTVEYDNHCLLQLPSGFTPNKDGFNDGYYIKGIEGYPENYFRVFNRWGNEVYFKENYTNSDWIGQNKENKDLPEGTYFVILEIKNSETKLSTFVDLRRYTGK